MRILVVGNFNEHRNGLVFYDITRKLVNGFIRNGHHVYTVSDRDMARCSNPFGSKELGARAVNRRVREIAENFRPDMVVLCHADTLSRDTVSAIKAMASRPKIVMRCVDPLFEDKVVRNIRRFSDLSDAVFVTTAGEALRQFAHPGTAVSFMPNPVDPSIETYRAFENVEPAHDLFFAARAEKPYHRVEFCRDLQRRLPDVRFDVRGILGHPPVYGDAYYRALDNCRMGLSLDRGAGELYASDRMAQYGGNGLLLLVDQASGFDRLFAPDEMVFYRDVDELVAQIRRIKADDAVARAVAQRGWAKMHAYFDCSRIARYIVDVAFRLPLSEDYPWPTELY